MAVIPKYGPRISGCTVIVCAALACAMFGCGPGAPTVSPVQLPPKVESASANLRPQSGGFYEVDLGGGSNRGPVYATALEQCGPSVRHSVASLSRQLLVGMEKVRISSRKPVELSSSAGVAISASAIFEGEPISLRSFSFKVNQCLVDVVFWRSGVKESGWASEPAAEAALLSIAGELLNSYRGGHAFGS